MKTILVAFISILFVNSAIAGGSIAWTDVSQRLTKDCPGLLSVINKCFDIERSGGAFRLGPRSSDVTDGRAGIGNRVPPYEFNCKVKGTEGPYNLKIEISDWDGGWKFIIREPVAESNKSKTEAPKKIDEQAAPSNGG